MGCSVDGLRAHLLATGVPGRLPAPFRGLLACGCADLSQRGERQPEPEMELTTAETRQRQEQRRDGIDQPMAQMTCPND